MTPIPGFGSETIYADYQATTPLDPRVEDRMRPYWRERFGNPHSIDHALGWNANDAVQRSAQSVAHLLGVDADEILFTSSATEANNLALIGLARCAPETRRRILVSAIEHKSVLAAADYLSCQCGFDVDVIPVNEDGMIERNALESLAGNDVLVASVSVVNNEIGTVQDIPGIAQVLRRHGIWFHTDAAQSPCAIEVKKIVRDVDLLSLSSHKIYGPPGIGSLYIRREMTTKLSPMIVGGGQQSNLRSGTVPVPICVGFGAACEIFADPKAGEERRKVAKYRDSFVELVSAIPGINVTMNGPNKSDRHPGNANLLFQRLDARDILGYMQPRLAASTGSACTSGMPEESHVLRAIGLTARESNSSIRFSFGRFTSMEEIRAAADIVSVASTSLDLN